MLWAVCEIRRPCERASRRARPSRQAWRRDPTWNPASMEPLSRGLPAARLRATQCEPIIELLPVFFALIVSPESFEWWILGIFSSQFHSGSLSP